MSKSDEHVTIRYTDGHAVEAILLSRTDAALRVAIGGADDLVELTQINGKWITEDCEPVEVDFEPHGGGNPPVVTVDDCICSHELAGRLLHMLFSGESDPETITAVNHCLSNSKLANHKIM